MSEFWNSVLVKKSRKLYQCEYCSKIIKIGDSYFRESGKCEGELQDYALCLRCRKLLISNDSIWNSDDGELGDFHENLMQSSFIDCPNCRKNSILSFKYSEDMMRVEIECGECCKLYAVDLSADNLLNDKKGKEESMTDKISMTNSFLKDCITRAYLKGQAEVLDIKPEDLDNSYALIYATRFIKKLTDYEKEILLAETKLCPDCGKKLSVKINRQTWQVFYGCSAFPVCKYTKHVEEEIFLD